MSQFIDQKQEDLELVGERFMKLEVLGKGYVYDALFCWLSVFHWMRCCRVVHNLIHIDCLY